MKRALLVAVAAALFASVLGGTAVAQSSNEAIPARPEIADDSGDRPDIGHILRRCRHLLGEDVLTDSLKQRCLDLWKRWCNSHPDSRYCRKPDVKPHDCRVADRIVDRRCRPDRPHDRPTDRPVDRPTDRPVDRPTDRPVDRPTDRPVDRPVERPVDKVSDRAPTRPDRASDQRLADRTDLTREKNDVHLRQRSADL